jgi:hypothetical protein
MWMAAAVAGIFASAMIAAATAIALSAREQHVKSGYRQEKQSFCLYPTFMWFLPCPIR